LQLRLFQTLTEISSEQSSTTIIPVPLELFRPYLEGGLDGSAGDSQGRQQRASQAARRREEEEEEAERLYEEAVGESKGLREIPQTREETG